MTTERGQETKEETVLTVSNTAEFLRVSESVIRRLIREQRIPYFKIKGRYLLFRPDLEEWIRAITVRPGSSVKSEGEVAQKIASRLWENKKGV